MEATFGDLNFAIDNKQINEMKKRKENGEGKKEQERHEYREPSWSQSGRP